MNKRMSIIMPIWIILSVLILGSCSTDEPDESQGKDDIATNEMEYLQNNLVVLDEDGNVKDRVYGRVLDESSPQTVFVGVDDFDEAKDIFASLFAPVTEISDDGLRAQFTKGKGNAELIQDVGEGGFIAHAIFNVEGLRFVSSMNFVLNSAWPENDNTKGYHTLGVQYEYNGWNNSKNAAKDDIMITYVCIRECRNGVPALLVGMSKNEYRIKKIENERGVSMKQINEIRKILLSNWNYFKAVFNDNGKNLLDEKRHYWINNDDIGIWYPSACVYTGKYVADKSSSRQVIFYKLSTQMQ